MKHSLFNFKVAAIFMACGCLGANQASAQTNYYFDPSGSRTMGSASGTGAWNTGGTSDWYNGTVDTTFPNSVPGAIGDTASNPGSANFDNSLGGTVTVSGTVNPYYLNFDGGNYTVASDGTGLINFDFPASTGYYAGGYFGAFLNLDAGSATINAPIAINATSNTVQYGFNNSGTGTLTLNGSITFNTTNVDQVNVFDNGGGKVVLKSAFSNSTGAGIYVGATGNMEYNGSGLAQLNANGGTILLDDSGYTQLVTTNGGSALTNGAVTINSVGNFSRNGGTFGGATADLSTFTGDFENYDAGTLTFTAAAGGRVDFEGSINYSGFNSQRVIITGPGVVVFADPDGNSYANGYDRVGSASDVGTEIESGATLLITNTDGSATGAGTLVGPSGGTNNVVQLDAGGTLGGSGITQQQIIVGAPAVAGGATAILAPGDAGQANLGIKPSIGTLTLSGGVVANNGLTMDFKLTPNLDGDGGATTKEGIDNDYLSAAGMTLNGDITINIISLGGIATGTPYTLINADGDFNLGDDATLTFNVPTGYALDTDFGAARGTEGYVIDPIGGTLQVQFIAVPEPSAYALMLGGLSLLGFCLRRKRAF
jgi:hypothetical protein